jgi:hypothetical protein
MSEQQLTAEAQPAAFVPSEREVVVIARYRQRQQERRAALAQLHCGRSSATRS